MPNYQPPFTITNTILKLVADIGESVGRLSVQWEQSENVRLRRINQIRTIQGSLAIEGNTLSTEQITAILEGKRVIAPPKEVLEARNALAAYEKLDNWHASKVDDLLDAHKLLMSGLVEESGRYRTGGVGVMSGDTVVHMAPQANRVQKLMADLLIWLNENDSPPLIASCVFHYEFEFIHPFTDGNGRMGRLWQTLILSQWHPVFTAIPVESLIHENQDDYYLAIRRSTALTDSSPFIEFMLSMILNTLREVQNDGVSGGVGDGVNVKDKQILSLLEHSPMMTQSQLAEQIKLSKRTIERRIKKLKQLGRLQRIGSDKTGHWKVT